MPAMPGTASPTLQDSGAQRYRLAFILVTCLFFLWGFSYGLLDVLNKHFQETLDITRARSALLQAAYFGAYFLMALPAAALMERHGYKTGILLGLGLFACGALLFIPATRAGVFEYFLFALFVIACGLACLETAANPYVTVLGPAGDSERRINLSQSFNGLGTFIAPFIAGELFFGDSESGISGSHGVQLIYVATALVVIAIAVLIWRTRMPEISNDVSAATNPAPAVPLFSQRHFVFAVVAQFFYVAAQVGAGAFFINYAVDHIPGLSSKHASHLLSVALGCFVAGRFLTTLLMRMISPARVLSVYAVINILLCGVVIAGMGKVSVAALIAVFFFMSMMFPTIFALGIKGLGAQTKRGASFIIMAIVGGAIVPWFMGRLADVAGIETAFWIPAFCFLVVALYGVYARRHPQS
ncbi:MULTISPECIES: L-fucose:H+ symporter permease [Pseudoxanthomonas]|jgi:FHS family L-fucose permease-like MFS transporter|uniref:L-fucose:H+ symporter permease n=1 Tax=Pseudoxanthomonas TaxID=83618 RepID=UPI0016141C6B|nr:MULTISPECIES: L-fucose:H+ symporter permease [Pseudoxanthomonas]MBB3276749.1 FHS family L-fucose permease-like MFS transporter [Pseudoxanthomonas sp. OG2]MBV7472179.1 L-fucose:H+ symporter permease [Pseudoxanthomonas sp. PXM05]